MALEEVLAAHQGALDALERSQAGSRAWSDAQRERLDRTFVEPLLDDGRRLLDALKRTSPAITDARRALPPRR